MTVLDTLPDKTAPGRLLVVDDDENNRDMLSRRLLRRGYTVACADSGTNALNMIAADTFDLILLDVMMPGISGIDVLRQIRKQRPATELPVIMATAKADRDDIAEALALGANDYVTKPIDFVVAVARIEAQLAYKRAVDKIVALERNLQRQNQELAGANARMRRELAMAARLQKSLLPAAMPETTTFRAAWIYDPCDELGGDILNVFRLTGDHVGLYLLDVSGHGVPAALLSVTLSRVLTAVPEGASLVQHMTPAGRNATPPVDVVTELNRRFPMNDSHSQYFTLIYGVLDVAQRQLRFCTAGHPPMLHVSAAGQARFIDAEGFAVGWVDDPAYEEHTISFSPGDRLYVYSDGITEAANPLGHEFGRERLVQCLLDQRSAPLAHSLKCLESSVSDFRGIAPKTDDISALAIEFSANG